MENSVPCSWMQVRIGDTGFCVTGNTPSTKESSNYGGEIPYIKPPQLNNKIVSVGDESLSEKGAKLARVLPKNSVLISCIGNLGKTALNIVPVAFNQQINAIVPNEAILGKFLFYQAQSTEFKNQLEEKATATTIAIVNKGNFEKILVNIAPFNEQKRIVAKIEELFSELDSGIAALRSAREQLKVYRQVVLKQAFEGKLTAKWREENADKLESPEQLLARVQQEREARYQQKLEEWKAAVKAWEANGKEGRKPGKPKAQDLVTVYHLPEDHYLASMPMDWACLKAEHLCDFITKGTTPSKGELFADSGEIPFIKVYNLTKNGTLDFSIEPTFISTKIHNEFLARSKVYPNDVLMNIVGPPLGKVSIVPKMYNEWNINQAIAIYRSSILLPKFLGEFLLFEKTVNYMMAQSKATAGQFNLTLEICRDLPIPVPTFEEQSEIVRRLEEQLSNVDSIARDIETQLAKTETLRQSILKKAFSGQLVPQDANDEPASELLARIQTEREASKAKSTKKMRTAK